MKFTSIFRAATVAALGCVFANLTMAQAPAPANPAGAAEQSDPAVGKEMLVHFDLISLPPLTARKALIRYPKETELYKWLDSELEKKDSGVVLERMHVLRVRGGQRSKLEAIHESAYPTEFDPPQISQTMSIGDPAASPARPADNGRVFSPWPVTSTTPSSFTFRNLGFTAEVELTIGEDRKTVDMNIAPELSKLVGSIPIGITGDSKQPVHETRKCSSQVLFTVGEPALVSTLSPPTGTGAPGGNTSDRVWLLFVTPTFPE
jgi:hypothetical protein